MPKKDSSRTRPCFEMHDHFALPCLKEDCRNWMDEEASHNCAVLAAREGTRTLQEIGDVFGITRMRVCQIEQVIRKKIRENLEEL